ncbi:MAG TPA: glycosyltransferase, partial [Longimicrobium sp.]|nr:glycosyltransferase [Longimicrobium sp.]
MHTAVALPGARTPGRRAHDADPRLATVVLVHERYREAGGEDRVFADEEALLRAHGHRVATFTADNREIEGMSPVALSRATVWNGDAYRRLRARIRAEGAGVVHVHNTFPLLSPAVYHAARDEGAAVVQTLHNYRLICPNALLFHAGAPCERCVGRAVAWPGVVRGCYRESRLATAASAGMAAIHRARGTWTRDVDAYIALSEFARRKFIAGGLPQEKLFVRPNYLADDPGVGGHRGGFALFVGRLSAEKGVGTLMRAWAELDGRLPLKVVGSGPLEALVTAGIPGVEWLGPRPRGEVLRLMRDAALLVFPSECYENFPLALVEAFATGLPVLAAGRGAAGELVRAHAAGLTFPRGEADTLASLAESLLDADTT